MMTSNLSLIKASVECKSVTLVSASLLAVAPGSLNSLTSLKPVEARVTPVRSMAGRPVDERVNSATYLRRNQALPGIRLVPAMPRLAEYTALLAWRRQGIVSTAPYVTDTENPRLNA